MLLEQYFSDTNFALREQKYSMDTNTIHEMLDKYLLLGLHDVTDYSFGYKIQTMQDNIINKNVIH